MHRYLIFILLTLATFKSKSQTIGIINDMDGYVNVRSGEGSQYDVQFKIKEGEKFNYWQSETSNWWKIQTIPASWQPKQGKRGFIHKSRIQPYYAEETDCGCYRDYLSEEKPFLTAQLNDLQFSICGYLMQRISNSLIMASEFHIFNCQTQKEELFIGAVQTCLVEDLNNSLELTFLKWLPTGKNWKYERAPISKLILTEQNGELNISKSQFALNFNKPDEHVIQAFLSQVKNLKEAKYDDETSYEDIINKLLLASISGSSESRNIFYQMRTKYFGFVIDGHLREQFNEAERILEKFDKKGSNK